MCPLPQPFLCFASRDSALPGLLGVLLVAHLFIQQVLIELLLCAKHLETSVNKTQCLRTWDSGCHCLLLKLTLPIEPFICTQLLVSL